LTEICDEMGSDLHWRTSDAKLSKYGPMKEVKFFNEKANGKSNGYCQVELFDPFAATTCKEGMNGFFLILI